MTQRVIVSFSSDDLRHERSSEFGKDGVDFGGELGDVKIDVASVLFGQRREEDADAAVIGKFPTSGAASSAERLGRGAFDDSAQAGAMRWRNVMNERADAFHDGQTNDAAGDERREFIGNGFFELETHIGTSFVARDESCLARFRIVARKFEPQRICGVFERFDEVLFGGEFSSCSCDVAEQVELDLDHMGSFSGIGFFEGDDGCVENFAFDDSAIGEDVFEMFGREERARDSGCQQRQSFSSWLGEFV